MTNDAKMQTPAAPRKKSRKIASLDRRKARAGWIFVLPFIIGFVLIYLPMLCDSVQLSFSEIKAVDKPSGEFDAQGNEIMNRVNEFQWVGFSNYIKAFTEYSHSTLGTFPQVLVSGLTTLAFDLPAILLFSLFMAVMLNQKLVGRAAFRSIFFVPVIISTGIMESIQAMDTLQNSMGEGIDDGSGQLEDGGLVNAMDLQALFSNLAVGQELVTYVVTAINNIFNIVNRAGVQLLIFMAALQSISPAIYESCKIDGATAWETFWKITFPMISPMILVNGIYTVIDSFTVDSNPVMKYVGEVFRTNNEGKVMSTAMSWVYFMIVVLILAVIAGVFSSFVFYQRKND